MAYAPALMRFGKGTSRLAFVGKQNTVKVPNISVLGTRVKELLSPNNKMRRLAWEYAFKPENTAMSIRYDLQGLFANQREGKHWRQLRGIALPTRTHFGGGIAVQPTATDMTCADAKHLVFRLFDDEFGDKKIIEYGVEHTLFNPDNYGIYEGSVQLRDFGDLGMPEFLLDHQKQVRTIFRELTQMQST